MDLSTRLLYEAPDVGLGSWENATPVDTGRSDTVALLLSEDLGAAANGNAPLRLYVGLKNPDGNFLERNGKLLFLAFLNPVINGRGFDFKEVEVSEEKRLDVVIIFGNRKYIIELKIWRGESYHRKGLEQLTDYLERQHMQQGYLLIYDLRKESGRQGEIEKIEENGKEIWVCWI